MVRMTLRRWRRLFVSAIIILAVALAGSAVGLAFWPLDAHNLVPPPSVAPAPPKPKAAARPAADYAVSTTRGTGRHEPGDR